MSGVEKAFELSVIIHAIDKLSGPMKAMEASMKYTQGRMDTVTKSMKTMGAGSKEIDKMSAALDKMARVKEFGHISDDLKAIGASANEIKMVADGMEKLAIQQERMAKLNGQMKGFTTTAVAGGVVTAGGIGMSDAIIHMLNTAGEFQTKLTVIQDLTGSNDATMAKFGDTVMSTSAKVSKFNDMQVAGFGQQLVSGGFPKLADASSLLLPVSQFAEVQQYEGKQSSPEEAVKQAIGLAHTFKHYDAASLTKFLDTFNKYSVMQPGSSTDLESTLTYLAPQASRIMGMSESDTMALAAIDNRIGLNGSHGGTNSADMILRLIPGLIGGMPTAKGTPKAYKAMEDLGLIDSKTGESKFFKDGKLVNLDQLLNTLVGSMQGKSTSKIATDFHDALGMQGGRAAGILGDETTIEQLKSMQAQLKVTKSMQQIQEDIRKTPQGQLDALKSNSMSLTLRVAQQLGYSLNPLLEKMNKVLEKMLAFSQMHPAVAKYVGTFLILSTAAMLVLGPLLMMVGVMGMAATAIRMLGVKGAVNDLNWFGKTIRFIATGPFKLIGGTFKLFGRLIDVAGRAAWNFGMSFMRVGGQVVMFLGRMGVAMARILAQAVVWAARMALQWLIAMGPIGWIILGVIAIVALLVIAWKNNWGHIQEHTKVVVGWIVEHFKELIKWFDTLPDKMMTIGKNIIQGIWSGIKSLGTWLKDQFVQFIDDTIPGPLKKVLGIHSPSRVMMDHGKNIVQGLALGMTQNAKMVDNASSHLATSAMGAFTDGNGNLDGSGGGGDTHIHVYPHAHQSISEIVDEVERRQGRRAMRMNMNTGIRLMPGSL